MTARIKALGQAPTSVIRTMADMGDDVCALDIKTSTNIWGMEKLRPNSVESRQWAATRHFSRRDRLELDAAMKRESASA